MTPQPPPTHESLADLAQRIARDAVLLARWIERIKSGGPPWPGKEERKL